MPKRHILEVVEREMVGRKVKQLRSEGLIPANIFGNGITSQAIQVDAQAFQKIYDKAGETSIIELRLANSKKPRHTLIAQIQNDPLTGQMLHVDFRQVKLTEKINANVPVEVIGESVAVKEKDGVFMLNLDEIEVEALPQDLPDAFTIDISQLDEIGDTVTVSALKTSDKVTILLEDDMVVASIQAAQAEEPEDTESIPEEAETTVQVDGNQSDATTEPDSTESSGE